MLKSATGKSNQAGFTLIEILVVIVIIGIMMTIALLSFGDFGKSKELRLLNDRLASLIEFTRIRAIITANSYKLDINQHGYTFYKLTRSSKATSWQVMTANKVLKPGHFGNQTEVKLNVDSPYQSQEILIQPNGFITPFVLKTRVNKTKAFIVLSGSANGEIHVK